VVLRALCKKLPTVRYPPPPIKINASFPIFYSIPYAATFADSCGVILNYEKIHVSVRIPPANTSKRTITKGDGPLTRVTREDPKKPGRCGDAASIASSFYTNSGFPVQAGVPAEGAGRTLRALLAHAAEADELETRYLAFPYRRPERGEGFPIPIYESSRCIEKSQAIRIIGTEHQRFYAE
jgi:hypothetical protein